MKAEIVTDVINGAPIGFDNPLVLIAFVAAMSLLPLLMLGVTSFVKLSVVFQIVRNALGLGQIPSAGITTLLALALTANIMAPVAESGISEFQAAVASKSREGDKRVVGEINETESNLALETIIKGAQKAAQPLKCFLANNAGVRERKYFAEVNRIAPAVASDVAESLTDGQGEDAGERFCDLLVSESWSSLIPAFVVSELRAAFVIGFRIFIPFVVIDLVVANILMGLGMMMVSPASISLPFKVLLFVMSDGWLMLCQSLVQGYN
jgi:type III secretion protein R